MKTIKGAHYLLSIFLFPLGAFCFLLILNLVMWGSWALFKRFFADLETAGRSAALLTLIVAVLVLFLLIWFAMKKRENPLNAAYWFPLLGIIVYYLISALLLRYLFGAEAMADIYMGPVLVVKRMAPKINVIGLDILAMLGTFAFGIIAVGVWAFLNRSRSDSS